MSNIPDMPRLDFIISVVKVLICLAVSAILAFIGYVTWIDRGRPPLRFTLRTLLIATALIAVVLGLIVYMARH